MQIATNISMTESAATTFIRQSSQTTLRPGMVLAMVYIEFFKEPDGTPVSGYQPGSWPAKDLTSDWLLARLRNSTQVYLLPKFEWSLRESYLMDDLGGPTRCSPSNHNRRTATGW
jgi:hypothetical protein